MECSYVRVKTGVAGLSLIALIFLFSPALWAQPGTATKKAEVPEDNRQRVEMPPAVQQVLIQDMISHLSAVDAILASLAQGDLKGAAEVAESKLGRDAMGRHAGTGLGPGRFMPPAMHDVAFGMHQAASAFAEEAKKGDMKKTYAALKKVTGHCVTCHSAYRIR